MYRNHTSFRMNSATDAPKIQRILAILCLVFFCSTVVFGVLAWRNAAFRQNTQTQLRQRMASASSAAVEEVNRMANTVTSNNISRISRVRQYVYHMEQLNAMSMFLSGGESGRLAPAEAFTALFNDLDVLESLTQAAKQSTLDARTQLLNHLVTLETLLSTL